MTYQKAISEQLLQGMHISTVSVLASIGTTELRHFIAILRKEGMNIQDKNIHTPNGKWHKEYFYVKPEECTS